MSLECHGVIFAGTSQCRSHRRSTFLFGPWFCGFRVSIYLRVIYTCNLLYVIFSSTYDIVMEWLETKATRDIAGDMSKDLQSQRNMTRGESVRFVI